LVQERSLPGRSVDPTGVFQIPNPERVSSGITRPEQISAEFLAQQKTFKNAQFSESAFVTNTKQQ
jgi:hypothetical protein